MVVVIDDFVHIFLKNVITIFFIVNVTDTLWHPKPLIYCHVLSRKWLTPTHPLPGTYLLNESKRKLRMMTGVNAMQTLSVWLCLYARSSRAFVILKYVSFPILLPAPRIATYLIKNNGEMINFIRWIIETWQSPLFRRLPVCFGISYNREFGYELEEFIYITPLDYKKQI